MERAAAMGDEASLKKVWKASPVQYIQYQVDCGVNLCIGMEVVKLYIRYESKYSGTSE